MFRQYVSESAGRVIQVEKRFAATTFQNKNPKVGRGVVRQRVSDRSGFGLRTSVEDFELNLRVMPSRMQPSPMAVSTDLHCLRQCCQINHKYEPHVPFPGGFPQRRQLMLPIR
jgi:hypothetical protein